MRTMFASQRVSTSEEDNVKGWRCAGDKVMERGASPVNGRRQRVNERRKEEETKWKEVTRKSLNDELNDRTEPQHPQSNDHVRSVRVRGK
jgi:hypothetical protein